MAEINLDGEPIFVDVANEPQFPLLYAQLLGGDFDAEESTKKDPAKPSTKSKDSETPETLGPSQTENVSGSKPDEMEITISAIKMNNEQFKCPICKHFMCQDEDRMTRHIRKHRGLNPFQCYMCDYSTYNSVLFKEHVNIHQGIKPFKCQYCDYQTASKKQCLKHERRHKSDNPLKCPDCEFIGRHRSSLRSHRTKEHQEQNSIRLYCKLCKCQFANAGHKRYHTRARKKCELCSYVTCSKLLYEAHLSQDHGIVKAEKVVKYLFTCKHCPWSSNSKPKILLHLIHHPNQCVDETVIDVTVLRNCGIIA
ncbi:hypothetical protein O0L34_g10469 [Tuta absoluta]|nr:hypothetical protein O0L34_g10469 [Tuta absoluta]